MLIVVMSFSSCKEEQDPKDDNGTTQPQSENIDSVLIGEWRTPTALDWSYDPSTKKYSNVSGDGGIVNFNSDGTWWNFYNGETSGTVFTNSTTGKCTKAKDGVMQSSNIISTNTNDGGQTWIPATSYPSEHTQYYSITVENNTTFLYMSNNNPAINDPNAYKYQKVK